MGFATTCSRDCHFALRDKKVERHCLQCGTTFITDIFQATQVNGGGSYCSRTCRATFRRKLRKRGEKNMFTEWQKREWKKSECARCGSTEKLELDHIVPRFAGGTTDRSNSQTLCRTCNRKKFWTDDYSLYLGYLKQRAELC
jgi:hypothetical protein